MTAAMLAKGSGGWCWWATVAMAVVTAVAEQQLLQLWMRCGQTTAIGQLRCVAIYSMVDF
jgi:hypothetical protein